MTLIPGSLKEKGMRGSVLGVVSRATEFDRHGDGMGSSELGTMR